MKTVCLILNGKVFGCSILTRYITCYKFITSFYTFTNPSGTPSV